VKVIIVGAGISGVSAAHILSKKGIKFEILEAGPVVGGRIKKCDDFADFPIDLGAEWVHKLVFARPAITSKLFAGKEKNQKIFRYIPKTIHQYKNGKLRQLNWIKYFLGIIQDFKFSDSTWFDFLDSMISDEIQKHIHLNNAVTKIDYHGEKVSVLTNKGQVFEAEKVLVTVPIKILQQGMIEFIPEIPAEQSTAINQEKVGDGIKVFMEFSERFYPDLLEVGKIPGNPFKSDSGYYDAAFGKNSNMHILALFAHGSKATKYTCLESEEKIIKFILDELDEVFDGQASKTYKKHIIQNWSQEPYICGSYSQRNGDVKKMSEPLHNKVFFSGEAMNRKGRTVAVQGAIESSYMAIEKILKSKSIDSSIVSA